MIRRPPRSTHCISSAASDVYKRQIHTHPSEYIKLLAIIYMPCELLCPEGVSNHLSCGQVAKGDDSHRSYLSSNALHEYLVLQCGLGKRLSLLFLLHSAFTGVDAPDGFGRGIFDV
eukprot:TRINITY_DN946_c0_g1_i1.p1 TRINITY_DN946_c0_g1~~TRINITY_DN946_c0_g1_i1.p1  ORF type:complete len:123 (-),score=19.09 TRINITY_DN946_c0_g1_i1:382-729(-)